MRPIHFEIEKHGRGLARAGILKTPHGEIKTPAFIAVGTKATVKGIPPEKFTELGIQSIIANTYHLYLSPGEDLIEKAGIASSKHDSAKAGGIHAFMGWDGPIMTDSGGFQVFSLGEGFGKKISKFAPEHRGEDDTNDRDASSKAKPQEPLRLSLRGDAPAVWSEELATSHGKLAIVDDDGVTFTSHLDGSLHRFTPERSIEIQHKLGADIIFAFDECTSPTADYAYQREAMDRTHRWAKRSLAAHRQSHRHDSSQGIYGIVQGGRFADLRIESAKHLADMNFDGYGIGGSFTKEDIIGILDMVDKELPENKPRHLLGIGEPEDLFIGAQAGIDTFDCVVPTRKGRTGSVYTCEGPILIRNAQYKDDFSPIDTECDCFVCKRFTRSYIHHLFRTGEMLGPILATAHNIRFLTKLTEQIRESIIEDRLPSFEAEFLRHYQQT